MLDDEKLGEEAAAVLGTLSVLGAERVPVAVLEAVHGREESARAVRELRDAAACTAEEGGAVSTRGAVQLHARERLAERGELRGVLRAAGEAVLERLRGEELTRSETLPHAEALLQREWGAVTEASAEEREAVTAALRRWRPPAVREQGSRAAAVREAVSGEARVALVRAQLFDVAGEAAFFSGELGKALQLWEGDLRVRKAVLGDEHPDVAMSLHNLAVVYNQQGEHDKALPLLEEAARVLKAALGDEHPDVATSLNNLAALHLAQGKRDEALPLLEEALRIYKAALGDEHRHVAATLHSMAVVCYNQGKRERGVQLCEEALRIRKAALGEESLAVASTLCSLAEMHKAWRRKDRAVPLYEEALRIRKAALGEEHPDVAMTLTSLAWAHEFGDGLPLHEESLRVSKAAMGEGHPDVLAKQNELANMYEAHGQHEEKALPLYEEVLRISKMELGDDHPVTKEAEAGIYRCTHWWRGCVIV